MPKNSISISSLSKNYGDKKALNQINLEIQEGEIFGLIGQNGAGKTTLLKILLGFTKSSSGKVEILGESNSVFMREKIGYLPEKVILHPFLTAIEFLKIAGRLSFIPENRILKRAEECLDKVGLTEERNRKLETFSKGMIQRIALAQAILHKPEILFLDEPGSGLDPKGLIDLRNLILDINRENKTTIFLNSHRLIEAEKLCKRISILHRGNLVATGTMDELTQKKNLIQIKLQEEQKEIEVYLQEISKFFHKAKNEYHLEPKEDVEERLLPCKIIEMGGTILKYEIQKEDLEEVFLRVIGEKIESN
jgi:ABC-2 type transport system ATP-binding protein